MNVNDVMRTSCELFGRGRFTDCCELLQNTVDNCRLNKMSTRDEVEFIILRNNLLVCNCLRIRSEIRTEYVDKMAELVGISKLYLYEKHVPLELRVNFVCNALYWYWTRPIGIPDYCYDEVITLVNDCLHEVLYENGVGTLNSSLHVGNEQDVRNTLECLSNMFLNLEPILVVQCLEIAQVLQLVFLSRRCFTMLLVPFAVQSIENIKTITYAFKLKKKNNYVDSCFKLGLLKMNALLDTDHIGSIIASCHVSLCIHYVLDNQYRQALCTLSTVDQYVVPDDELFCLVCYLKAFVNFNLEEFEVTLYYLSQMVNCSMEPFIRSRYYILLGRTRSKMNNGDLALSAFEKLKETEFHRIMAYYMSQHYEMNNMQFKQMIVLEQVIKEDFVWDQDEHDDFSISYVSKVLSILHPKPDLTRKQLLYLAAKKKYELGSYKLAVSSYLSLLKLNEPEQYVSDLVTVPTTFMLKHETIVALLKAREMDEAFKLCQIVIEEFEPGCNMWKSGSFWASELNDYDFNVIGAMLLAETGFNKNTDVVLEALNKSFNCLYAKINCDRQTESSSYDENIKSLRQMLIGKILLLKATILSKLDEDDECESAFKKALMYNSGDEDIVYLYSKWLEHKGKISQSLDVRGQFDRNIANKIVCDNVVMIFVLENKHGHDDSMIGGNNLIDDLFANTEDQVMEVNDEMDPADDDIFNDLFLD